MRKFIVFLALTAILSACGTQNPAAPEAVETDFRELAVLKEGRLAFANFKDFSSYWGELINREESFLDMLEQSKGYTSERTVVTQQLNEFEVDLAKLTPAEREELAEQDLLPQAIVHDPYLQTILNKDGVVQISDIVFLITQDDVIAIPEASFHSVNLDDLASKSLISTQSINALGIEYSPIERSMPVASSSELETQGVIGAIAKFVVKYLIPRADLANDQCLDTYYRKRLRARRVVGASGAAKLTFIKLPMNPAVYGVFAGTGNVGRFYTPNKGRLRLTTRTNIKVSGNLLYEKGSRVGYRTYTKTNGSTLAKIPYWAAGINFKISGSETSTHTASDRGRTGTCTTSETFSFAK